MLLCAATLAKGATPTIEAFRGTNEVLIASNRFSNKIIIGPATRISVTASNAAQSIANNTSNALRSDISNLQGATNGLNTDVSNLQNATNALQSEVSNLQGATNGLQAMTLAASNSVVVSSNALRTDISNLQGSTNGLQSMILSVSNSVSVSSNALRTDIGNLQGATNGLQSMALAASNSVMVASNALRTDIANLQGATNGLQSMALAASNSVNVASNALRTDISNLQGATNGLQSMALASSNSVMIASNAIRTDLSNLQGATNGLQLMSLAASNFASTGSNFLWGWANAISNYVTAATNSSSVTNWINSRQPAAALSSNLVTNPYVAYTNVLTKTATTVSGAGNGNTNYLLALSTNANNYFYLGSSNVIIYTVGGSTLGSPILWTAIVTNLSANTWGFTVASGTNRWRWFHHAYGTNRPITLTNNTALCLTGQSDGTNTLVSYYYFSPGL